MTSAKSGRGIWPDIYSYFIEIACGNIICVEKIGGFTMTVSYSVLDSEAVPGEKTNTP